MDKFEQRARKIKVDDAEVNRIRKNIQTVCSNHSTMYNKLKEFCLENDNLKSEQERLMVAAKVVGVLRSETKAAKGCQTALTQEGSGFKKLVKLSKTPRESRTIRFVDKVSPKAPYKAKIQSQNKLQPGGAVAPNIPTSVPNQNVQYMVQTVNGPQLVNPQVFQVIQPNGTGGVSNIPVQVKCCLLTAVAKKDVLVRQGDKSKHSKYGYGEDISIAAHRVRSSDDQHARQTAGRLTFPDWHASKIGDSTSAEIVAIATNHFAQTRT